MGMPGPWELIIILLIVVMIFGARRIPEIMGGVGKGIRTFKKTMESDEPLEDEKSGSTGKIEQTSAKATEQIEEKKAES
jgi:sec-independent protein translocase protein TatA